MLFVGMAGQKSQGGGISLSPIGLGLKYKVEHETLIIRKIYEIYKASFFSHSASKVSIWRILFESHKENDNQMTLVCYRSKATECPGSLIVVRGNFLCEMNCVRGISRMTPELPPD